MGDLIRRKDVFDLLIGEFKNDEDLYVVGRLAAGVWMIPVVEAEPVVHGERKCEKGIDCLQCNSRAMCSAYAKFKYQQGYDKAIDDLMNALCDHCIQEKNECYKLECPFCGDGCDIVNIAEQLKGCVKMDGGVSDD